MIKYDVKFIYILLILIKGIILKFIIFVMFWGEILCNVKCEYIFYKYIYVLLLIYVLKLFGF